MTLPPLPYEVIPRRPLSSFGARGIRPAASVRSALLRNPASLTILPARLCHKHLRPLHAEPCPTGNAPSPPPRRLLTGPVRCGFSAAYGVLSGCSGIARPDRVDRTGSPG